MSPSSAVKPARTLSFVDIVERMPPSMIQLLTVLAPAIHVMHHALLLVTWRGGYAMRVQSWILLVAYVQLCLYGYEVLRYAPQLLVLALLGYTWLHRSCARITGHRRASDERGSPEQLRRALVELADVSDFAVAMHECFVQPVYDVLTWQVPGYGPVHLVLFLLVTWPVWLLCMLPSHMWLTHIYATRANLVEWLGGAPTAWAHRAWAAGLALWDARIAPHVPSACFTAAAWLQTHVMPHLVRAAAWLTSSPTYVSLQLWPPFPIASLSVRHVLLFVGVLVLSWCSPWATLLRMALWRSAFVRHSVMWLVHALSGSETLAASLPTPKAALAPRPRTTQHETPFVFEIYENQRWWIGLDWTAALLPQERPSWSDSDNAAVAPPASFALPRSTSVLLPSSHTTGKSDRRTSEWRWVDTEWRVAGVVGVSSSTYTPAASTTATEAQREEASQREHVEVPDEVRRFARPADMPSASMDVDAEGWQYGDNAWDKFSKQNGMGRYTRRRRWLRKAVLVQTVEYGV